MQFVQIRIEWASTSCAFFYIRRKCKRKGGKQMSTENTLLQKKESVFASNNTTAVYINSFITLALMFGFGFLPPVGAITPLGMRVAGIFLGMIWGWLTVALHWPSVIGLIALGLSGYANVTTVFAAGFGHTNVMLVLFMMIFAGILNASGAVKGLADKLVSLRIARGKPWMLSFLLCLAMFVLSCMISLIPAILIMWTMLYGICEVYGIKQGEKWPMLMLIGIVLSGSMAFQLFPFKSLAMIMLGSYQELSGETVNYLMYFLWMLITDWVVIGAYLLLCRFVFRPDVSKIANSTEHIESKETITPYQKFILIYFLTVVALLLFPSIMPKEWAISKILNNLGTVGTTALAVFFMVFLNLKQGKPLKQMVDGNIDWNSYFLLAGAMVISKALESEETGITQFISDTLSPLLAGKSVLVFSVLLLLTACIVTNFCNNLATGIIFTPIAYTLCVTNPDVNVKGLMMVLITVCSCALATPAGSLPAALVYGNKEWVTGRNALKYGVICVALDLIIMYVVGLPLANVMFH